MKWKVGALVHSPSRAAKAKLNDNMEEANSNNANSELLNDGKNRYNNATKNTIGPNNSQRLTIFLLVNSMIGSGILNQPYVFMKSGVVGALIGFTIATLGTWSGLFLLTEAGIISNNFDFAGLARDALGSEGDQLVDGSIILMALGSILSYIIIIGETTSRLVQGWGCNTMVCDQLSVTVICVALFVTPVCMFRSLGNLAKASVLSILAITTCLLMVLIAGPSSAVSTGASQAPVVMIDIFGATMSTGSIILALNCSSANFHAYLSANKESKSITAWMRISGVAVTIGSAICVAMGLGGYLAFRDDTNGEILNNFPSHSYDFVKVMIVCHLILYIPMQFVVMRHSIVRQVFKMRSEDISWPKHASLTVGLLAAMTALVLHLVGSGVATGTAFTFIVNLTGGISGSLLTFVLPGIIYRRLVPPNSMPATVTRTVSGPAGGSFLGGTLLAAELRRLDHRDRMRLIAQGNIFLGIVILLTVVATTLFDASAHL